MAMKIAVYTVPARPSRLVYFKASSFLSKLRGKSTREERERMTWVRSDSKGGRPMDWKILEKESPTLKSTLISLVSSFS
jgi:hypothetical protein